MCLDKNLGENPIFDIVFFPGVIFKAIACLYLYNFLCLCNLFFRLGVSLICDLYFFTGTLECLRPTCLAGGAFLVAGELSVGTTCLQMRPAHPHLLMLKKKTTSLQMISSCPPFKSSSCCWHTGRCKYHSSHQYRWVTIWLALYAAVQESDKSKLELKWALIELWTAVY